MGTKKNEDLEIEHLIDDFEEELEDYLVNFEEHLLLFLSLETKEQENILHLLETGDLDAIHDLMASILYRRKVEQLKETLDEEKRNHPTILN